MTPPPATPRLTPGINTCFAVKRWPRVADWSAIVSDELGLSDIQFSMDCLPPGAPAGEAALRAAAEIAVTPLAVHSVFTGLGAYGSNLLLHPDREARDGAEQYYRDMITVAATAGAHYAGGHIGALSVADAADAVRTAALRRELLERMARLADYAAASGLRGLLFENLAVRREPGWSVAEARELELSLRGAAVPWRLCLDVGHPVALSAGGDPDPLPEWLSAQWQLPPVVQLQNASPGADAHGGFGGPGGAEGPGSTGDGVDLGAVVRAVAAWDGTVDPLFLEVIPAHEADDAAVLLELRSSVARLRAEIARA